MISTTTNIEQLSLKALMETLFHDLQNNLQVLKKNSNPLITIITITSEDCCRICVT